MKNLLSYKLLSSVRIKITLIRLLILVNAGLLSASASGQAAKQLVLADEYFDKGEYVTAAGLYGQYLDPSSNSKKTSGFPLNAKRSGLTSNYQSETDVLFRQAESYRLAHDFEKAAELYNQCFEKDSRKYNAALYWKAVCDRSIGNYQSAEQNIDRFIRENESSELKQPALEEKKRLQFIREQSSRPDSVLYHIQKLNSPSGNETGVYAFAALTQDRFMFTGTQKDSVAAGENPYHNKLFSSVVKDASMQDIQPIVMGMNAALLHEGTSSVSADGKFLYFTQWNMAGGQRTSVIMVSKKSGTGWSEPQLMMKVNRQGSNSLQPSCSQDGKFLFFASDRKDGHGGLDIWYAPILPDGTTGDAVNAGPMINTSSDEQAPFYHEASHCLVFSSDRMPGMGGYDLFVAKGAPSQWQAPQNMGAPVNSSRDDLYFFATGNDNLLDHAFISSDRGSSCCLETFMVSKKPKNKMLTGIVRDCANNAVIDEASVFIKDATGKSLESKTGADGSFNLEWSVGDMRDVMVSREKYNDKSIQFQVASTNESNPFTDTIYHAPICMDKKLVLKVENVVTVYFNYNESRLKPDVKAKLDSIYRVLVNEPNVTIQVSGYSDDIGSEAYNKKLSEKRAKACVDYLVSKGIDAARISYASFGACCPVEMKLINVRDKRESKSLDRRALINISRD
jgi:OOP family OmpA-OmpF porin